MDTRGPEQNFLRFRIDVGILFDSFLDTEAWNFIFCSGLFPGHFPHSFFNCSLDAWGSTKQVLQKQLFTNIVFYDFRGLAFYGGLGSSFSGFCCLGNTLEH